MNNDDIHAKRREERLIARWILRQLEAANKSMSEVEDMIEDGILPDELEGGLPSLRALKERGELEHMMWMIWYPTKRF